MTIKELEEFRMICQRGSLARASKELFMSPQGLSRVLKNLENELECTLVDRVVSGIELTESGERLYAYAEVVLGEYEKMKKDIENIRNTGTERQNPALCCHFHIITELISQIPGIVNRIDKILSFTVHHIVIMLNQVTIIINHCRKHSVCANILRGIDDNITMRLHKVRIQIISQLVEHSFHLISHLMSIQNRIKIRKIFRITCL